jgi:hypothetical protein
LQGFLKGTSLALGHRRAAVKRRGLPYLLSLCVLSHPVVHDANGAAELALAVADAECRNNLLAGATGRIARRIAPPRTFAF